MSTLEKFFYAAAFVIIAACLWFLWDQYRIMTSEARFRKTIYVRTYHQ